MAAHRYHKVGDIETDGEQLKHNTLENNRLENPPI
jgi:hypothetical protein